MTSPDEVVVLEGGSRHGEAIPLSATRHVEVGVYEIDDPDGVYRHNEEAESDFRDGQRRATFVPAVPGED